MPNLWGSIDEAKRFRHRIRQQMFEQKSGWGWIQFGNSGIVQFTKQTNNDHIELRHTESDWCWPCTKSFLLFQEIWTPLLPISGLLHVLDESKRLHVLYNDRVALSIRNKFIFPPWKWLETIFILRHCCHEEKLWTSKILLLVHRLLEGCQISWVWPRWALPDAGQ